MGIGTDLLARALSQFGAIISQKIEDQKAIDGIAFSVRKRYTIASSGVLDLVFDPTAFTGQEVVLLAPAFDALGGPLEVDIYAGVTANSDGTPIPIFNRNFKIGGTSQSVAQSNPTGIVLPGTPPIEVLIPSDGTPAVAAGGAAGTGGIVSLLDPTVKYLLRITNTDGTASASIGVKLNFFEVV